MEGKAEPLAGRWLPIRVDLLHQFDGVPHQAEAGGKRRFEVVLTLRRRPDRDAEQGVEAARGCHVGGRDADRVETGFHAQAH